MKKNLSLLILSLLLATSHKILSQVVVTFPTERAVFQRNNANEADVYIGGYVTQPFQKIEVRLTPRVPGEGESFPSGGGWALLDEQISAGQFF